MKRIFLTLIIIVIGVTTNGSSTFAVELRFDISKKNISKDEEFTADLLLDTKGEIINAIEAEITYPKDIMHLVAIYEGSSIVPLWPLRAKDNNGRIPFSGVIPNGFNGLIDPLAFPKVYPGTIFRLVFAGDAKGIGEVKIENPHTYKSDGRGTEIEVTTQPILVSVSSYTLNKKYEFSDTISPEFQSVIVEPEGSVFPKNKALIFLATDKESGIKEYQIKLNDVDWFVTSSPYQIESRLLTNRISIKAIDLAGNERITEITIPAMASNRQQIIGIAILVLILVVLAFLLSKIKKMR